MKEVTTKLRRVILLLLPFLFVIACSKPAQHSNGYLEGTISIGPICPVERIPPDPACLPTAETYKAYPVSIFTSGGKRKISQLNPSLDGSFSIELQPGNYLIVLETSQKMPGGSNLPVEINVKSDNTTLLYIDIDTGIR